MAGSLGTHRLSGGPPVPKPNGLLGVPDRDCGPTRAAVTRLPGPEETKGSTGSMTAVYWPHLADLRSRKAVRWARRGLPARQFAKAECAIRRGVSPERRTTSPE
jgi:hypothetical protein